MGTKNIFFVCIVSWLSLVVCADTEGRQLRMSIGGSVIIDTDAGVDDAMAILMILGFPKIKVEAITCVRGNTDVVNVAINVQKTLDVANRHDIPLHIGSDFGLVYVQETATHFGEDGFGDLNDNSHLKMVNLAKGHAAMAMSKLVSDRPGEITILCMGPLTNLALACHIQPHFLKLAKRVIILGGSVAGLGNVAPGVEFNFYMDPEAAALVLNRALATSSPVILFPVETLTAQTIPNSWRWNILAKIDSPAVRFLNRLEEKVEKEEAETKKHRYRLPHIFNSYDVFLPVVLMRENFIQRVIGYYLTVDTHGKGARGTITIDHYNLTRNPPNAVVISRVKTEVVQECLLQYLAWK